MPKRRSLVCMILAMQIQLPVAFAAKRVACGPSMRTLKALDSMMEINDFETLRGIEIYQKVFGYYFRLALRGLGPHSTWIDMGAGIARALTEYYFSLPPEQRPRLKGVVFRKPELEEIIKSGEDSDYARDFFESLEKVLSQESKDRFDYLKDRYVEDIPIEELGGAESADILTDMLGPLTYTRRLGKLIEKYGQLLTPHGKLFVFFDFSRLVVYDPVLRRTITMEAFFRKYVKGLRITRLNIYGTPTMAMIERTDQPLVVPKTKLRDAFPGNPVPKMIHEILNENDGQ